MAKKTFTITTPIYYTSGRMHIGHSYTTVAADTMARFKKLTGHDVYFLTGTDEHGQKVERRAAEAGVTPQCFVDGLVADTQALWKRMDIEYDDFIRTTEARHTRAVQKIFRKLYEQGDIYKGEYEGLYCTPCEAFWTQTQLVDGKCPDCGRPVEPMKEVSYFFRLSKYRDWLIRHIEEHPDFIQPPSRAHEMLSNFLRPGLQDLCVSRTTFTWGVPVDFDPGHVVYVWIDALSNYITALGYGSENTTPLEKYWPADVQLVGKEIVRFHTIIWPILLKALGLALPRQVFGHGWLNFGGDKMSKSKGNVVDPVVLCDRYSSDAIRYFLMREMPFGADGNFTNEALLTRLNADLANDLGNLVSRTVAMMEKYFDGRVPAPGAETPLETALRETALALPGKVARDMDALQFSAALADIWQLIGDCNRYIDATAPWLLAKRPEDQGRLCTVLYHLAECVRVVSVLVGPFMPGTPARIHAQIGLTDEAGKTWDSLAVFGALRPGAAVRKGEALFPRLDIPKELEALSAQLAAAQEGAAWDVAAAKAAVSQSAPKAEGTEPTPAQAVSPESAPPDGETPEVLPPATLDDFAKIELKVATVLAAEAVKKSDKLLQLTLKVGGERRTVLSGIAAHYAPESLVGKKVVLFYNLAPRRMRGVDSQGMILAAGHGDVCKLLTVDGDIEDGSEIS